MKKQLTLVFAVLIAATTFAQKAKVLKGDFKDLKGITEYNLVFDYSDLEINLKVIPCSCALARVGFCIQF